MLILDGNTYLEMLKNGYHLLANNCDYVNSLNVFPVPDGDTGTNMSMTLEAVFNEIDDKTNLSDVSKWLSRQMILCARGNSGVILSQYFKGLSNGFKEIKQANAKDILNALLEASKKAYSVVSNPTEGTILTVIREAAERVNLLCKDVTDINIIFKTYLDEARKTLDKTKEMLQVLKDADVIDSGGAGFCFIIDGALRYLNGEIIENKNYDDHNFKYQVMFKLSINNEIDYNNLLKSYESISSLKNTNTKNNVLTCELYTNNPDIIISKGLDYGDFIDVSINNIQTFEAIETSKIIPHKEYAIVAVSSGDGISEAFKNMGVDVCVTGGQTMNTSTNDFIEAFKKIDADYIIVYPNNSNIIMAANVASQNYDKSKVIVIPTKTIIEGYSAISMLEFDHDIENFKQNQMEIISNVKTLEVTYSVRDTVIDSKTINKGDYICIYGKKIISINKKRLEAVKEAFNNIENFKDFNVLTVIVGNDVYDDEINLIEEYAKSINRFIDLYRVNGKQDLYSYIIGLE